MHRFVRFAAALGLGLGCGSPDPSTSDPPPDLESSCLRVAPVSRLSPGCFEPAASADGIIDLPTPEGATPRVYEVELPDGYDPSQPAAAVYYFHSCGGDASAPGFANLDRVMETQGAEHPTIVITGQAAGTCWDISPQAEDLAYVRRLREEIEANYCIDLGRIHHGGFSSGAFASNGFACELGATSVVAASGGFHQAPADAALHDLTPLVAPPDTCKSPVPVVLMHGRGDPTVSYEEYAESTRDAWRRINGCSDRSRPYAEPVDLCEGAPAPCECRIHDDCTSGAPVVFCRFEGAHEVLPNFRPAAAAWYARWARPMEPAPEPEPAPDEEDPAAATTGSSGDLPDAEEATTWPPLGCL